MEATEIKKRTVGLVRENPITTLATTDSKTPYQRLMMTIGIDDDGTIYYSTSRESRKAVQIQANPGVSVLCTSFKGDMMNWESVTVMGNAKVSDDKALRERFWKPEFTHYYPGGVDDPRYVVIIVKPYEARYSSGADMRESVASY